MRVFLTLTLLFTAGVFAPAQTVPNQYIVTLEGEPAAPFAARQGHRAHPSDQIFRSRAAQIRSQHEALRPALEGAGAEVLDTTHAVSNSVMVRVSPEGARKIAAMSGVKQVHQVRLFQKALDRALPLHHVPDAWNQVGGMGNAGAGVKIAIIDTGIDSQHPAFQDASLPIPDGYPQVNTAADRAYTNNKIIVARSYSSTRIANTAQDVDGHGTGVAMTAAGLTVTGPNGTITGVAPRAYLGNYKVFQASGGAPDNLIIKAIDDAVADGMDVLNLSLGSLLALRPQDDALVQAVENAVAAGKLVIISAGNGGPDPNTIGSPGSAPDAISVGSMSNDRIFAGSFQNGDGAPVVAIPGDGPNSKSPISAPLVDAAQFDPTGLACSPLPAGSVSGAIALVLRGTCTFETKINNAAQGGAVAVLVYAAANSPDPIGMATGAATLPASMVSNATGVALKGQIASGSLTGTLVFTMQPLSVDPNRISGYSSVGPNVDSGVKPDLIAVGESMSTAKPVLNDGSASDGYVVESGTSFSSPMVAGAAALLKAARPGLTAGQYRSLLINTAARFDIAAPVQRTGSGFLNMQAALQSTVTVAPTSLSFGAGGSSVNQTQNLTLTNIGTVADTFSVSVVPASGSASPAVAANTVQLEAGASQSVSVQFSSDGLSAGAYQGTLQIQGTQNSTLIQVPYWYGAASGIPAHITILDSPMSAKPSSNHAIAFRITDAQGLPIYQTAAVSFTTGNGRVLGVSSLDTEFPGAYQAGVRLGTSNISDVITIQIGSLSKDVTIQVSPSAP